MKKTFYAIILVFLSMFLASCQIGQETPTIISIDVVPSERILKSDGSTTVTSIVTGTGTFDSQVQWTVVNGGGLFTGVTSSSVTYLAPSVIADQPVIIQVTSVADKTKFSTVVLTIKAPVRTEPETVLIEPQGNIILGKKGATYNLSGKIVDVNNRPIQGTISWLSSDPSIVNVNSSGQIEAIADYGFASITANYNGTTSKALPVSVARLAPKTKLIDGKAVTSITATGNGKGILVLQNAPNLPDIQVGDIVVSDSVQSILAKVVSKNSQNNELILEIETQSVSANDAFENISFKANVPMIEVLPDSNSMGKTQTIRQGGKLQQIRAKFQFLGLDCERNGSFVRVNFSAIDASLSLPKSGLAFFANDIGTTNAHFRLGFDLNIKAVMTIGKIEIPVGFQGELRCKHKLGRIVTARVLTPYGVTFIGSIEYGLDFTINSSTQFVSFSISEYQYSKKIETSIGFEYKYGDGFSCYCKANSFKPTHDFNFLKFNPMKKTSLNIEGGFYVEPTITPGALFINLLNFKLAKISLYAGYRIEWVPIVSWIESNYSLNSSSEFGFGANIGLAVEAAGAIKGILQYVLPKYFNSDSNPRFEFDFYNLFVPIINSPSLEKPSSSQKSVAIERPLQLFGNVNPHFGIAPKVSFYRKGRKLGDAVQGATPNEYTLEWIPKNEDIGDKPFYTVAEFLGIPFYSSPSDNVKVTSVLALNELAPVNTRVGLSQNSELTIENTGSTSIEYALQVSSHTVASVTPSETSGTVQGNATNRVQLSVNCLSEGSAGFQIEVTPKDETPVSTTLKVNCLKPPCPDPVYPNLPCSADKNFGDPHIRTRDGFDYNFQAVGEFVFTRSSLVDMPLEYQVRYKPVGSDGSMTSAAAVRVGTDRIGIYSRSSSQLELKRNGITLSADVSGFVRTALSDNGYLFYNDRSKQGYVSWKDGSSLSFQNLSPMNGHLELSLNLHGRHRNQIIGLGGNFNLNSNDDLRLRNGTVLPSTPTFEQLYDQFGNDWRVTTSESLFDYGQGESTATFTDINFPPAPRVITPAERTAAEAICRAAGIQDPSILEGCIYDVVVTGDQSLATSAALSDPNADIISLNLSNVVIALNQTYVFNALLPTARQSSEVQWTITGGTFERISSSSMRFTPPETLGTFSVTAKAQGGTAVATATIQVVATLPTDSIPPTISLSANATAVNVGQNATLTALAADNVRVARVEFYEGSQKVAERTSSPYQYVVSNLTEGTRSFSAKVFDATGNSSTSNSIGITAKLVTGIVRGQVRDTISTNPVSGVSIGIQGSNSFTSSINTDTSGLFSSRIPLGVYTLTFSKAGYQIAIYSSVELSTAEQILELEPLQLIGSSNSGTGTATGTVKDAFTGQGLSGVSLSFRSGINVVSGTIAQSATTNTSGTYSVSLNAGYYTVTASKSGYVASSSPIYVVGGTTKSNQNISITPTVLTSDIRIILTWGNAPADLDSHFTGDTNVVGQRFHVYYGSKSYSDSSTSASLDVDSRGGFGPETVTSQLRNSGVYRYSVHNFTNAGNLTSNALSLSNARVQIYRGSSLIAQYNVPTGQAGILWTVFEIQNNTLRPVNTMSFEGNPDNVRSRVQTDAEFIRNLLPKR
jgi:hypothetical protein